MKTKITAICNYHEIPFEPITETISASELNDEIQNEIDKVLLTHKV